MGPERLTELCVDAIASTGQGTHYRCPGCGANLVADTVESHAQTCSTLREWAVVKENEVEAPGTRVAYDFKSHLIVRIINEPNGTVGLYYNGERLVILPTHPGNQSSLAIASAILGAFEQGKKVGVDLMASKFRDLLGIQNTPPPPRAA